MSQEEPACGYIAQPPFLITPPPSHITTPCLISPNPTSSHITSPSSHITHTHLMSHHLHLTSHVKPPLMSHHISHLTSHHHRLTSHVTLPSSHISSHHLHLTFTQCCLWTVPVLWKKKLVISRLFSRSCGYMNRGTVNVGDVYLFTQTPRERATMVKLK